MRNLLFQLILCVVFTISANAQDTVFYDRSFIKVPGLESCMYYQFSTKDKIDPNQQNFKTYYKSGKIKSTHSIAMGFYVGKSIEYYENGQVHSEIEYGKKGFVSIRCYWKLGKLKRDEKYVDGKMTESKCYNLIGAEIPYFPYEVEAEFPGGEDMLAKFLTDHVVYPPEAQAKNINGKVVVHFVVTDEGKIEDVKVLKAIHPLLDAEAIRVVKMMPVWKPGKQDGEKCSSKFTLPIVFQL